VRRSLGGVLLLVTACTPFGSSGRATDTGDDAAAPDAAVGVPARDAGGGDGDAALPDPRLVGAWSFDRIEGGVAVDESGHGHDATVTGTARFAADGHRDGAVAFDGEKASVVVVPTLADAAFPRVGTLSIWVRFDQLSDAETSRNVFDVNDEDRQHVSVRMKKIDPEDPPAGTMYFSLRGASDWAYELERPAAPVATWLHVVVTWSETTGSVHIDGVLVDRRAYEEPFSPIAQRFVLGAELIGRIDEVRLYGAVLSDAEIAALP
jgi:hypothetical protein